VRSSSGFGRRKSGGYLKFDNRTGKLIRSSQRNEGGIKKEGEREWEKAAKKWGMKKQKI
jgi:hypothetical protein